MGEGVQITFSEEVARKLKYQHGADISQGKRSVWYEKGAFSQQEQHVKSS